MRQGFRTRPSRKFEGLAALKAPARPNDSRSETSAATQAIMETAAGERMRMPRRLQERLAGRSLLRAGAPRAGFEEPQSARMQQP